MTQVEPDFKPFPGETVEQKRERLAAKQAHKQAKENARRAQIEVEREAHRVEREKVMKPLLFDLMLKAKEYGVDAEVHLHNPNRDWYQVPGVLFDFGMHDSEYLAVDADPWEVETVMNKFKAMDEEKAERARQEALVASAREKLLNVLNEDERAALKRHGGF